MLLLFCADNSFVLLLFLPQAFKLTMNKSVDIFRNIWAAIIMLALVYPYDYSNAIIGCFHKIIVCDYRNAFGWYETETVLYAWSRNDRKEL